jgi:hypothetical protein
MHGMPETGYGDTLAVQLVLLECVWELYGCFGEGAWEEFEGLFGEDGKED